jgi:hypothetical protein
MNLMDKEWYLFAAEAEAGFPEEDMSISEQWSWFYLLCFTAYEDL